MRIFALSDIHVDYEINARWVADVSLSDFQHDVLILAGDVSDNLLRLDWCLSTLARRFHKLLFVPGNHELWVMRDSRQKTSWEKFHEVTRLAESAGASGRVCREAGISIVPLLGWYDYSFGEPSPELKEVWMDYHACRWPSGCDEREIAARFAALNPDGPVGAEGMVITFSHFLPRIDVMPSYIPQHRRMLYPILGSDGLERQLRVFNPSIHVYGHSHVNRTVELDGITYINNAFGYPEETRITGKRLLCIHEC